MLTFAALLAVLVCVSAAETDQTLVDGARGRAVVEATISKIEKQCFFNNDKLFIRRLAYVETTDGTDDDTFKPDFYGGIWKIDEERFKLTKSLPHTVLADVQTHFNVDWQASQWKDLLKPYYSGLAAYLYLEFLHRSKGLDMPLELSRQADVWKEHFTMDNEDGHFLTKAKDLEKKLCKGGASDVVFVVDGSGSIQPSDFRLMKDFIVSFMKEYEVGADPLKHSRFSFIQFSSDIQPYFHFTDWKTLDDYTREVQSVVHLKSTTNTHKALDYVAENTFKPENGARQSGVSRVVVVLTDGVSSDQTSTLQSAKRLHEKDVTVFVVGIGKDINAEELEQIASDPNCLHINYLKDFNDFDHLRASIVTRTCSSPIDIVETKVGVGDGGDKGGVVMAVGPGMEIQCRIKMDEHGNTIEAQVQYPTQDYTNTIYFSKDILPNPSFYEYKLDFQHEIPSHLYIPYDGPTKAPETIFCYIEGKDSITARINISVEKGG